MIKNVRVDKADELRIVAVSPIRLKIVGNCASDDRWLGVADVLELNLAALLKEPRLTV